MIQDGDFEVGNLATNWNSTGEPKLEFFSPISGAYSCQLRARRGTFFGVGTIDTLSVVQSRGAQTLLAGRTYRVTFKLRGNVANDGALTVALLDGAVVRANEAFDATATDVETQSFDYVAATTADHTIRFTLPQRLTDGSSAAFIDDVSIDPVEETSEVITRKLRDLLVQELERITTDNGFSTTVRRVYTRPVSMHAIVTPSVGIVPQEGGTIDVREGSVTTGEAQAVFTLRLAVQSSDPYDDAMNLLDDVRNAVERPDSLLCGTSIANDGYSVWHSTIDSYEVTLPEDEGEMANMRVIDADVLLEYQYQRGSA